MNPIQHTLFEDTQSEQSTSTDNIAIAMLALSSIRGVGFATIKAICDELKGDLTQVFRLEEATLNELLYDARTPNAAIVAAEIKGNSRTIVAEGRRQWAKYRSRGVTLLLRNRPGYPDSLLELTSPPSWLFVEGDAELLSNPFIVGFVGTRSPTIEGLQIARRTAAYIAHQNCVILSGLAEGIDAVGHQTAILFGAPTVAVLGHGIDVVFPASTAKVRQDIVAFGGAVVSEYLPADNYSRDKFVHRNRIQAAISKALCIVEAKEKSGTAHTLRFAQHLGRPIFGVYATKFRQVPEEELLQVLAVQNGQLYDIDSEEQMQMLTGFLHVAFTKASMVPETDAPRMFRNIAVEVRRLAEDYGASESDIKWLISQIRKIPSANRGGK